MRRDILRKFVIRSSSHTNFYTNFENLFTYPLGLVSLSLRCLDGTNRKTYESKLYEAAK